MPTNNYYVDTMESNATTSYAQIVVPGYSLVGPAKAEGDFKFTTAITGNSFIRLGASPVSVSYANGTFAMSTDASTTPTGFDASLTLAKLVANMDAGGSKTTVAGAEATPDTTLTGTTASDSGYYQSDPYKGSAILGFADDTRVRDDADKDILYLNGGVHKNSPENRRTESYRLLSKGGWWDHSDGNRISTTAGDKVEVVQGNYKMLVLGRRAPSDTSDKKVVDISGGFEFSKRFEYLTTDSIWATWEQSSPAHSTKVSSGKDVSYFKGAFRKTIIGKHPDGTEERPDIENETYAKKSTSKTEADKIEVFTGTAANSVNHQLALTYCLFMEDVRFGVTMQDFRIFALEHLTFRGGAVVAGVNVGAVNVTDVKAAPLLASISVCAVKYTMDVAPIQYETKLGVDFKFNPLRRVTVDTTKAKVTALEQSMASAVTRLNQAEADICDNQIDICKTQLCLLDTALNLANQDIRVATAHILT